MCNQPRASDGTRDPTTQASALMVLQGASCAAVPVCTDEDEIKGGLMRGADPAGMMSSLKTLDLSYNRIGDKGACALGSMLSGEGVASSLPLQSLELEGNQVGAVSGGGRQSDHGFSWCLGRTGGRGEGAGLRA